MPRPRLYATSAAKKAAYRQRRKIRERQEAHRRSQEWRTPPEVFADYARIFPFTVDVAALPENAGLWLRSQDDDRCVRCGGERAVQALERRA